MIVALLNHKGGVGKTTLALHLAGEWARKGCSVTLIDADPQGSALDWSAQRVREGLRRLFGVIGLARDTLHREAPAIARGVDHVVIDGPRVATVMRSTLLAAVEKNDRKKLEAAKAIERPKTIWISRRKPPVESPKDVVRPLGDPAPVCSHARGPTGNLMVDSCSKSLRTGSLDSHSCAPANPIKRKRLRRGIFDKRNRQGLSRGVPNCVGAVTTPHEAENGWLEPLMAEAKKARAVGFNHVAIEVGDIEEALAFYARLVDFKLRGKSKDSAFIDLGDQFLALQKGRRQAADDGRHFGLVVDDKEAVRKALAEMGVETLPGQFLDFLDPWGNRIEIVGYDNIQFTKAPNVLRGMGLSHLSKNERAIKELKDKGMG